MISINFLLFFNPVYYQGKHLQYCRPLPSLFFCKGGSYKFARNPIRFMQEYERLRRRWENTSLLKKWRKTMYKQTNKQTNNMLQGPI